MSAIVLAGGRSTRFGSDKLRAAYRGRPLLQHAVLGAARVAQDVVVVLAPDVPEPEIPPGVPVRFTRDEHEGRGPLAGALAGLRAVSSTLALVVGGDMPDLPPGVAREMLRRGVETGTGSGAVVLGEGSAFRPLPAVLELARAQPAAECLLGGEDRSLRALVAALTPHVIPEAEWTQLDSNRRALRDIDEPADLEDAESGTLG